MTAIAKSRTPTITQANVALQSISPSHSASAIVRAKAPTIMAHIKSINDTAQYRLQLFVAIAIVAVALTVVHSMLCLVKCCAYLTTQLSARLWCYKYCHRSAHNCATKRKK